MSSPAPTAGTGVAAAEVRRAVEVAAGRAPGTLHLRGGRVVNVFTSEILEADVLVAGRLVAAVLPVVPAHYPPADDVVDLAGSVVRPGYIDGHVHLESSLVTPAEYARCLLPRGVTGVVCDPHELANVAGEAGVAWLLAASADLPFDVWVTAPSCVPSSPFETIGADYGPGAMARLLDDPRSVGVAELMSFGALVAGDERVLTKARLGEERGRTVEGHAPALTGAALQAYLAAGVGSDHESTTLAEGLEKLRAGAFLMIREGSVTRDLDALMSLVDPRHGDRIGFVTDDRLPHDLLTEGGVDLLVRRAVAAGRDAAYAVRCASYNHARHFRLPRRGAVAAGYLADLAVGGELSADPDLVLKGGQVVARGGLLVPGAVPARPALTAAGPLGRSVRLPALAPASFAAPAPPGPVRVIRAHPNQILTTAERQTPTVVDGLAVADPARDLAKLACVERHGRRPDAVPAVGFVAGFGLRRGALASSVGHDHHNVLCVGTNDRDMLAACLRLAELGGGLVACLDGAVVAELELPIGGIVTDVPLEAVRDRLDALDAAARSFGCELPSPYMALSFMGLAVIPELRLTDLGLVDVGAGRIVPLAADA